METITGTTFHAALSRCPGRLTPILSSVFPALFEYYYRTRSANDYFIAGDCGAGYVNPTRLLGTTCTRTSGLPSAEQYWVDHNLKYNRLANCKITGFVIQGTAGRMTSQADAMYAKFAPDGAFTQGAWLYGGSSNNHLVGSMPFVLQRGDLDWDAVNAANQVQPNGSTTSTKFINWRSIIRTPGWVRQLIDGVVVKDAMKPWAVVDASTYCALQGRSLGLTPDNRATYTFDTIPSTVYAGFLMSPSIGVRNDGWVTWKSSGAGTVTLVLKWMRGTQEISSVTVPLPRDVPSSEGIVLDLLTTPPTEPGDYTLHYEMARDGVPFSSLGDYSWEKKVTVAALAKSSCSAAKESADGAAVTVADAVVTAGTDKLAYRFYIENPDRSSGIQVYLSSTSAISAAEGDRVSLTGTLSSYVGERRITTPTVFFQQPGIPLKPLAMTAGSVGGSGLNAYTPGYSLKPGLYNTGLLVTVCGKVTLRNTSLGYFYIDDGSGRCDATGNNGICVYCTALASGNVITLPNLDQYVAVTGISSLNMVGTPTVPVVRPRSPADVRVIAVTSSE